MSTDNQVEVLREAIPLLVRNEGVWEGWYRYFDISGRLIDQHRSRLFCRLTDDGPYPYHQTNQYVWEDGRTEFREFPARYADGRIWFENELISGWAAAMQPDDFNRSTCLHWTRIGEPDLFLYEMIQLSDNGVNRARTWHWFRGGVCFQRTLIDEKCVTRDWLNFRDTGVWAD